MLPKASRDSRNYSGPSPGRLCACLCADGARSGQSCCEVHPERWVPLARLLPGSVLYGRCTRHRGNLPHIEFLYLGDFILFPFKSAIHGPQWENLVFSLLCFGQTPHMTNVNCYTIFANAFLFIPDVFHQLTNPDRSASGPREFKALSPQTDIFPLVAL